MVCVPCVGTILVKGKKHECGDVVSGGGGVSVEGGGAITQSVGTTFETGITPLRRDTYKHAQRGK